MSAHSNPEGLAIARELIACEAEERTGFLDLGMLGLVEPPEGLSELKHLKRLNLGSLWWDEEANLIHTPHRFGDNTILGSWSPTFEKLSELSKLDCWFTEFSDLTPLQSLSALTSLNCSETQVSDLTPLQSLSALTSLDCSGAPVSDLTPLQLLPALTSLVCSETQVSDLSPLQSLAALTSLVCSETQVSDLSPLQSLAALTSLVCWLTPVRDLTPLQSLSALTSLDFSGTQVSDLTPLQSLSALTSLDCSGTQVSDLTPLQSLSALTSLDCSRIPVSDLTLLQSLPALTSLVCSETQVSDLSPLQSLSALTSLDCSETQVSDLTPLQSLSALASLDCSETQVSDLTPLQSLSALTSLDCSGTPVSDLTPLQSLSALTSLNCSETQVSDLTPLQSLSALTTLNCSRMPVSDLTPLRSLSALRWLNCSSLPLHEIPNWLIWGESLKHLVVHDVSLPTIPAEVLSAEVYESCLESLRSHLADLKSGDAPLPDVKMVVLGNGRIGKTQLCRRLRGEPFEANADSTHGVTVSTALLPGSEIAHLHLWDFGGQDLYHGTHALFMRTRAIVTVLWTPESENSETHEYGGMTFRNQPLAYWLSYVRHLSGTDCPLLVVQNQCDTPEDELLHPPLPDEALEGFGYRKILHYSAKEDRGRAALDEALRNGVDWLREKQGQARIGKGRLAVKRRLEKMRDADAELPAAEKRHRTITQEHFHELCAETDGGVSSPPLLLDYLHQCGIVFYRKGLFGDRIVLDQAWALDAVYAVFNRKQCYHQLKQLRGRFTRPLLEALVWQDYGVEEQRLFLSMMESCGICFIHRNSPYDEKIETEYIAPDLLPDRSAVADEIDARWPAGEPHEEIAINYPFLHSGLVRGVIARVGREAGLTAIYWNEGVCGYERQTRSHVMVEARFNPGNSEDAARDYSGQLVVRATGAQPGELLARVETWINEEGNRVGTEVYKVVASKSRRPLMRQKKPATTEPEEAEPIQQDLVFTTPPRDGITYCVSYAWRDDSVKKVDELCSVAESHGITILRDTTGMGLGDSISKFMHQLADGDRVFVILSEKYLKSPYCMAELLEVWRNSRQRGEEFLKRVRVYRLEDAKMMTPLDRAQCAVFWKEQFEALNAIVKEHGADLLGEADFGQYKLMQDFAHRVGDILALIADTLHPPDFAEFLAHGFEDSNSAK